MYDTVSMKAMRMTGMTPKRIQVLNNDIRFSAEDILATDWSIG
jgi:hypothetical protein